MGPFSMEILGYAGSVFRDNQHTSHMASKRAIVVLRLPTIMTGETRGRVSETMGQQGRMTIGLQQ